jgi:hypothetical protein
MTWKLRRRVGAALAGALAALALVASVGAGGWATVVLDGESAAAVGDVMRPGAPVTIGFTVLQHGTRPMADLSPRITLTSEAGGAPVNVEARAEGEPGHYVATISLPEPGVWRWQIDAFGPLSVMAPITVAAAPAPAAPVAPPALAILFAAAAALALLGLVALGTRRTAVATQ